MYPRVRLIVGGNRMLRGRPRISQAQIRNLLQEQPEVFQSKRPKLQGRNPEPFRRGRDHGQKLRPGAD